MNFNTENIIIHIDISVLTSVYKNTTILSFSLDLHPQILKMWYALFVLNKFLIDFYSSHCNGHLRCHQILVFSIILVDLTFTKQCFGSSYLSLWTVHSTSLHQFSAIFGQNISLYSNIKSINLYTLFGVMH